MTQGLNPLVLLLSGFDWSGRTGRVPLALLVAVWVALGVAYAVWADGLLWVEAGVIVAAAALFVPLVGHLLRRINDIGWSGWWVWVLALPWAGLVFLAVLLVKRASPRLRRRDPTAFRGVGFMLACGLSVLLLTRLVWAPYQMVAGTMKPNLLVGDVVIALRHPLRDPLPGDVVVFRHPRLGTPEIARVVAQGGDRVQMRGGVLFINDASVGIVDLGLWGEPFAPQGPLRRFPRCENGAVGLGARCEASLWRETLPGGAAHLILDLGPSALDPVEEFTVPAGHSFRMGDHRDNVLDSRMAPGAGGYGMVPAEAVTGRVLRVAFSAEGRFLWMVWTWRWDRIWEAVA